VADDRTWDFERAVARVEGPVEVNRYAETSWDG